MLKLTALKKIAKGSLALSKNYAPEILTGVGIAGYLSMVPLTVKAVRGMDEDMKEFGCEFKDLSGSQKVKTLGKHWWYVAVTYAGSTAAVLCGRNMRVDRLNKQMDVVKTLLVASQGEVETLKNAIDETVSANKKKQIMDKAEEETVKRIVKDGNPETIIHEGGVHFIDMWSGTKFVSTFEAVNMAFANFAYDMLNNDGMEVVNQLRFRMGLDAIGAGEYMYFGAPGGDHIEAPQWDKSRGNVIEIDGIDYVPIYYTEQPVQWDLLCNC